MIEQRYDINNVNLIKSLSLKFLWKELWMGWFVSTFIEPQTFMNRLAMIFIVLPIIIFFGTVGFLFLRKIALLLFNDILKNGNTPELTVYCKSNIREITILHRLMEKTPISEPNYDN